MTYQLKILTTALFSVLILRKQLTSLKWGSLVVLFVGVALVQVQSISPSSSSSTNQNRTLGLIAVIISCLSSGFAGVYFEMMLKGSNVSVWLRNVQLGMFGFVTALLGMIVKDGAALLQKGLFFGYSPMVVFVISQQAMGGLIVALVVRYADNILKGFATSLSIILSCITSVFLFDYKISLGFTMGAGLVIMAIYLYGKPQTTSSSSSASPVLPTSNSSTSLSPTKKPSSSTQQPIK